MHKHSIDWFVSGALFGAIATAALVIVFKYLGIPSGHYANDVTQLAAPIIAAACMLFLRPVLLKTGLNRRSNPFLLDEDLNAMLLGRALGVLGGACMGITLFVEMF